MSLFARIANDVVAEPPIDLPDGMTPDEMFSPEIAATVVPCGADVREGWLYDGKTFTAPKPFVPPLPSPQTVFSPRDFMALFTPAEQTALFTARRTSVEVDQFITLAIAGNVDVTNAEVIADINAIASDGLITAARAKQILAGQAPAQA